MPTPPVSAVLSSPLKSNYMRWMKYTPVTPPPLCLLSPSTSSENGETTSLERIQRPSKDAEPSGAVVSLSTSFHPSAGHCGDLAPDLVLLSSDSVFFYVHSSVIRSASNNNLCGFLTSNSSKNPQAADQPTMKCPDGAMSSDEGIELVMLPDQSQVLNIMLHFIYNISPAHHSPPFHIISQAVERLHDAYGVDVHRVMQGSALGLSSPHSNNVQSYNQPHESSLFTFLAAHAPLYPIEVYALAASIDLYSLAQNASLYLHELDICPIDGEDCAGGKLRLTPEMARKMGGVYLMRLIGMHKRRLEALRTAVCTAPEGHLIDRPSEDPCSAEDQASLKRAWALAAAYIVCTAGPGAYPHDCSFRDKDLRLLIGVSAQTIDGTFRPFAQHVACSRCRQALDKRLESMNREWRVAPVSLPFPKAFLRYD